MLMTWIIYYSPHIFSLRSKDLLIRFIVSYPTDRPTVIQNPISIHICISPWQNLMIFLILQVLFIQIYNPTLSWWYSNNPMNTQTNTDDSPTFVFIVYLQLLEVRTYHISCVRDTINGSH